MVTACDLLADSDIVSIFANNRVIPRRPVDAVGHAPNVVVGAKYHDVILLPAPTLRARHVGPATSCDQSNRPVRVCRIPARLPNSDKNASARVLSVSEALRFPIGTPRG